MDSKKQVRFGAIISYIAIFLDIVAGLIFTPWIVRTIGKANYGLYTVVNSIISLFLIDFGLSAATSKFVSQLHANGRDDEIPKFLGLIYKLYFIVDLVILAVFVVVFFCIGTIYANFTAEQIDTLKVIFVLSGSFAVLSFPFVTLNGILNSYEKFVQMKFSNVLNRLLIVGFTSVALLLDFGLYGVVGATIISGTIVIIYKLLVVRKIGVKVDFNTQKESYGEVFKFSVWTTLTSIAGRLIFNIMPTILGLFTTVEVIAVFGVVTTLEGYSYLFSSSINGMFLPRVSSIYAKGENIKEEVMNLTIKVGKFQFGLNSLIVVGLTLVGSNFIYLWMGEGYMDGYLCSILVIVPSILFNPLEIPNTAMIVDDKVHLQAIAGIATGLLNVGLSFAFVPWLGLYGACISICISYFFRVVLLLIFHRKYMEFDVKKFSLQCYLRMSIPTIITLLAGGLAVYFIPLHSWLYLALEVVIITVIYLIALFLTGVNKEERAELIGLVKRFFEKVKAVFSRG